MLTKNKWNKLKNKKEEINQNLPQVGERKITSSYCRRACGLEAIAVAIVENTVYQLLNDYA